MKIDIKLERAFSKAIQKPSNKRSQKEENTITQRNNYITGQFEWTKDIENKLLLINTRFREEEIRIFKQYRHLKKNCQAMVDSGEIEDFELEVEWSCWNESHYIKYDDSIDGNPFYTNSYVGNFMIHQHGEEYVANDHNTIGDMYLDLIPRDSTIITEPHCYMFHHLYDHCNELTWFDISNIDSVQIEIKVRYQFFPEIK